MTDTANLALPFIDGSQAQKHVTHNEALRILDAAIQIGVVDMTLTAPPPAPADGERHVVASGATGAWAGQANAIATWEDGAWRFLVPRPGWCLWSAASNAVFAFDGAAWNVVSGGLPSLASVPLVGVNATASSPNLLSVRSNAALFNSINAADGGSGDARIQISKESGAKTASVVFSDAFSGRAEFGLVGDDDFHLKVSPDGTTWRDAMIIARTTGKVSFPSGGVRERLTANRTYYFRNDGSDGNNGLTNSSGGAFLTAQKAIDVALATLDFAGFDVIVQFGAAGTYTTPVAVSLPQVGAGRLIINGDVGGTAGANAKNYIFNTSGTAITCTGNTSRLYVQGFTVKGDGGLIATDGALLKILTLMRLGACTGAHLRGNNGILDSVGDVDLYIDAGAQNFALADPRGYMNFGGGCRINIPTGVTLSLGAFAAAGRMGMISFNGTTITNSGTVTGQRYNASNYGLIYTNGGGANFLPGSTAGTDNSGSGKYV